MIALNLISLEQKKEIKLRHVYIFIKNINFILIFIALLVAIILMVSKSLIQLNINRLISQTILVVPSTRSYANSIVEVNKQIDFVHKIQDEFIPWSNLIKNLSLMASADINFYYLKVDSSDKTIKIKGNAALRDGLLNLKQKMESSKYFHDIEFPIKNILEKENIDFEIKAKLNIKNI